MTARDTHLVRDGGRFPTEAQQWHQVSRYSEHGTIVTACGERIEEPKNESTAGEPVPNLSGETVCYDCAKNANSSEVEI